MPAATETVIVAVVVVPVVATFETTAVIPVKEPVTVRFTVPVNPPPRVRVASIGVEPPCRTEPLVGLRTSAMVPGVLVGVPPEEQAAKTAAPRSARPERILFTPAKLGRGSGHVNAARALRLPTV